MVVPFVYTEEEYKKLEQERDFFKEQAILWRNDWKVAYEENKKLNEKVRFLEECLDRKEKVNKSMREEIDNGFNRETDLRNKRADSLLENKDLRDKIEELEKEIEELNKMMLFETELEK